MLGHFQPVDGDCEFRSKFTTKCKVQIEVDCV